MRCLVALAAFLAVALLPSVAASDTWKTTNGGTTVCSVMSPGGDNEACFYTITTPETTAAVTLVGVGGFTVTVLNPTGVDADVQVCDDTAKSNCTDILTGIDGSTVVAKGVNDPFDVIAVQINTGTAGTLIFKVRP